MASQPGPSPKYQTPKNKAGPMMRAYENHAFPLIFWPANSTLISGRFCLLRGSVWLAMMLESEISKKWPPSKKLKPEIDGHHVQGREIHLQIQSCFRDHLFGASWSGKMNLTLPETKLIPKENQHSTKEKPSRTYLPSIQFLFRGV